MSPPPTTTATQLRKGVLELAILTLLAEEESYGAELVDRLSHQPGLSAPAGTVYPLLDRLERAGMLESHWDESPRPGARRRLYRLTPEGRQVAHQVQRDAAEQAVGERDAALRENLDDRGVDLVGGLRAGRPDVDPVRREVLGQGGGPRTRDMGGQAGTEDVEELGDDDIAQAKIVRNK